MDFLRFMTVLRPDANLTPTPAELIAAYQDEVPRDLTDLWATHGLGSFGSGALWFLDPTEILEDARALTDIPQAIPFARTAFGNFYSLDADRVLSTHVEYRITDQVSPRLDVFGFAAFSSDDAIDDLLMRPLKAEAEARLGPLSEAECYGYRRALALGGSEDVDNLEIKNFAVYLAVLRDLLA